MVFDRFCDFIIDIFQVEKDSLSENTSFIEDLGADEEDFQELIMIIEEEFDILLSLEEISEFETLGEISKFLEQKTFEL